MAFLATLKASVETMCDKRGVRSLTLEDPTLLRDRNSYEADLRRADSSQTGLKRDSVLNN